MTATTPTRYCPLCACQKPRQNGWFLQRVDGIKTWVCPVHKETI